MKIFLAAVTAILVSIGASNAAEPNTQLNGNFSAINFPTDLNSGEHVVTIGQMELFTKVQPSSIAVYGGEGKGYLVCSGSEVRISNNFSTQPACDEETLGKLAASQYLSATSYLPVCSSVTTQFCITSISATAGLRENVPLKFEKYLENYEHTPRITKLGFQEGYAPSIWSYTESADSPPIKFLMTAVLHQTFFGPKKLISSSFEVSLIPFEIISTEKLPVTKSLYLRQFEFASHSIPGRICFGQLWESSDVCAVRSNLSKTLHIEASSRMPNGVAQMVTARALNPVVEVTSDPSGQSLVKLSGDFMNIPYYIASTTKSAMTLYGVNTVQYLGALLSNTPIHAKFSAVREIAKDTASGFVSNWSFNTAGLGDMSVGKYDKCIPKDSSNIGLVNTNAMMFYAGAPSFNGKKLSYQLAGMHTDSIGKDVPGLYNLEMNLNVAKCLFRIKSSNVKADISIVDAVTGEKKLFTSNFKIDTKENRFKLQVANFGFSEPIVEVALR